MKNITGFTINQSTLLQTSSNRQFTITGETGAEFLLQVFNTSTANYKTFPSSVTSVNSPALPSNASEPVNWDIENTESDARGFGLRLIRQPIDTDWYFTASDTVNNRLDNTIEKIFSTVDGAVGGSTAVTLDADYTNAGGGIIEVGDYVFGEGVTVGTTVAAVNVGGDAKDITLSASMTIEDGVELEFITATTEIIIDDLTDIVEGMVISTVSGTNAYLIGTPTITSINTATNTLTLSAAQAFVDDITLAFQARGSSSIKKATGANIDFSGWNADVTSATSAELTKTVRSDSSGTTVDLNGTYGIAGGNHVTIAGVGVNNASTNTVVSVSASSSSGSMVMTLAQNVGVGLAQGAKLYFTGSTQKVTIINTIPVSRNPDANRTIYLDLDNFITVGAAS